MRLGTLVHTTLMPKLHLQVRKQQPQANDNLLVLAFLTMRLRYTQIKKIVNNNK